MGYMMTLEYADFNVSADNKLKALEHAKTELLKNNTGGWAWVSRKDVIEATTFEELLKAWRWDPEEDSAGNIIALYFDGEKLGDDEQLWSAIAPYVKSGSYIEMNGEDGTRWRWRFEHGHSFEQSSSTAWENIHVCPSCKTGLKLAPESE